MGRAPSRSLLTTLVLAGTVASCVLADPPPELRALPVMRPTIVHGSVVPSPARVLGAMPDEFVVPVELLDPRTTFAWRVFLDYDPLSPSDAIYAGTSAASSAEPDERVRVVRFGNVLPTVESNLDTCHVVELIVAQRFVDTSVHTPDPTTGGGDAVVWLVNPSGTLGGCPVYDAGSPSSSGSAADGRAP